MKPHTWQPHPEPISIPHCFHPKKCAVCGLEMYDQYVRMKSGEKIFYNMYWRNGRRFEEMPECVNWEEENLKRID